MAKTKNRTHKKNEEKNGYIREMEAEIRSLRKQLKQYEKYEQRTDNDEYIDDTEDTHIDLPMKKPCEYCGKGTMVETLDLGHRGVFGECAVCGHKGKMK